ncbi:hypothetical protein Tco_0011550 [Tanacetum coccineum]
MTFKDSNNLYRFKEGDFHLRINDIEDMLLLVVQNRLTNLSGDDVSDFAIALRMFTRSLVIQKRVEDLQQSLKVTEDRSTVTSRILPLHSDTKVIHNDDGNPSRANIKQALVGDLCDSIRIKLVTTGKKQWSILTDSKDYIKMDMEVPGSSRLTRFIATCSYSTDTYKDIMKAQIHVSRLPLL